MTTALASNPVTPVPGLASSVVTGGTAVEVVANVPNGGYITNPASNVDQGVSPAYAENIYVDPVAPCGLIANGTTVAIAPGQSFLLIPGQNTAVWVNAPTAGHKFTVVVY